MLIRPASFDDLAGIRRVSLAAGQPLEDSGASPNYVAVLLATGTVEVLILESELVGWGAVKPTASGSLLTDLFVDPSAHGRGVGSALLAHLWHRQSAPRYTFSSQHPHALPVYARAGLAPLWPLLYLSGDPARLDPSAATTLLAPSVSRVSGDVAAQAEESFTGFSRAADYDYWSQADGASSIVIRLEGRTLAAGVVQPGGVSHLAVNDGPADVALIAALQATGSAHASVCLPGPHPALTRLLNAGFRVDDYDIHMSTPTVNAPVTWAYSPGLG